MKKKIKADPFPMMENMTVEMVRKYLKKKRSVIIPLGVIEQHGYHLPLNTDALIARHTGKLVGEKTGTMVAPVIHTSFSGGGLPGTINISPSVMSLVVSDTLISLVFQGFRNVYLLLCHGGSENVRALDNAVKILLRTNPAFENVMIALMPTWKFGLRGKGWNDAFKEGDWHAGWLETSVVMALAPELVRMEEMELDPEPLRKLQMAHPDNYQQAEKIVDDSFVVARMTQRLDIKVGVMGIPAKASAELGREILNNIVQDMVKKILYLEKKSDGKYKKIKFVPEPIIFTD